MGKCCNHAAVVFMLRIFEISQKHFDKKMNDITALCLHKTLQGIHRKSDFLRDINYSSVNLFLLD